MAIGFRSGVERLGARRVSRLEELYAQHIDWAEAVAFLLTHDTDLAQDLAQESFIRVAGRLHHIRHPDAFRGYLRRTLVNVFRTHFRRIAAERRALERAVARREPESALHVQSSGETARALATLPPRQRAAVVLRYYEDLSEEQAADVLRCSKRAVNALVSRALGTLRGELQGATNDQA